MLCLAKTSMFLIGGLFGADFTVATTGSTVAANYGWNVNEMKTDTGTSDASTDQITSTLSSTVTGLITAFFGIAILFFILKIALTGIQRGVLDQKEGTDSSDDLGFSLCDIPFIGAYKSSKSWADIWKHFILQVVICAGAWLLVNLVAGIVLMVFQQMP